MNWKFFISITLYNVKHFRIFFYNFKKYKIINNHSILVILVIILAAATLVAGWMWISSGGHLSFLPNGQNDTMKRTARLLSLMNTQWRIHKRGFGGLPPPPLPPPYFLDQTEAQRAKKHVFETLPPYLRVWMTVPPSPLSEDLDPPLKVSAYKCYWVLIPFKGSTTEHWLPNILPSFDFHD